MRKHLYEVDEVQALVERGNSLLLAGDEALLRKIPRGSWIGGTIPYFMSEQGGVVDRKRIFVNELPPGLAFAGVRRYDERTISRVYADLPAGSLGVMIAPAWSPVHLSFALNAPHCENFAFRPLIGWIAGVHLSELGKAVPHAFDGTTGEALTGEAVVMQVSVARGKVAELGILNIFRMGDGPAIKFPSAGFSASEVEIDGTPWNLAEFMVRGGFDTRLPLVADYCGSSINVSFQEIDRERGEVRFFAPVFPGIPYRLARPISDYVAEFVTQLPKGIDEKIAFSCNCILNYLHSNLEGKSTGEIVGPITFGEIAYQLLNQTMAYLTIVDAHA